MNDIYGWKCGWKIPMDELFHEHWQQAFLCEKWTKKIGSKKFNLVYLEKIITWNVEIIPLAFAQN